MSSYIFDLESGKMQTTTKGALDCIGNDVFLQRTAYEHGDPSHPDDLKNNKAIQDDIDEKFKPFISTCLELGIPTFASCEGKDGVGFVGFTDLFNPKVKELVDYMSNESNCRIWMYTDGRFSDKQVVIHFPSDLATAHINKMYEIIKAKPKVTHKEPTKMIQLMKEFVNKRRQLGIKSFGAMRKPLSNVNQSNGRIWLENNNCGKFEELENFFDQSYFKIAALNSRRLHVYWENEIDEGIYYILEDLFKFLESPAKSYNLRNMWY